MANGGIHAAAKTNLLEVMMKIIQVLLKVFRKIYSHPIFREAKYYGLNVSIYNTVLNNIGILNYQNSHRSGEYSFLKNYLSKINSPVVFDVGANKGDYIKEVNEINKGARIYAFEPDTTAYNKLTERRADSINLYNFGMSDKIGKLEFYNRADEL
jgi:hypothetical protein